MIITKDRIFMREMDDFHLHLRLDEMLRLVLPYTVRCALRAVIMPNTRPRAILTDEDVIWYRDEIARAHDKLENPFPFKPLMTIEIRDSTTPQMIIDAKKAGAIAGKVYPLG